MSKDDDSAALEGQTLPALFPSVTTPERSDPVASPEGADSAAVLERSGPAASPSLWELTKWLVGSTKEVLGPLAGSTVARILDQLAGIALFVLPVVFIANAFSAADCGCTLGVNDSVAGLLVAMIFLTFLKGTLRYFEQYLGHLVAFRALEILRGKAFRAIYPQAPAIEVKTHSGELLARLTKDIDRIEVFFAHTLAPAISAAVVPGIVSVVTFAVAPWPLGVAVAAIFTVGLAIPWIGIGAGHRAARDKLAIRGDLSVNVTDSLGGVAEVIGYGLEKQRLRELDNINSQLLKASVHGTKIAAFRESFLLAWRLVALLILLGVGGDWFAQGKLSLAVWLAVIFAVLRSWDVLKAVANFGVDLNVSFAAAARVYRLAHAGMELVDGKENLPEGALGLEFRGVNFAYETMESCFFVSNGGMKQHTPILSRGVAEVSLEVKAGSWTAVVGATGSGKSTLARLALRFFDPDSGSVCLAGRDLRDYQLAELRREISLVSANSTLFDLTVAENLRLAAPDALDDELWEALRLAAVDQEIREMGGLTRRVGSRGAALSGGQQQRIALAQALLRRSRILILDEYTANLNPELAARIAANLRALQVQTGITVLEITHNLDHIEQASHVAVLDLGRIIEQGAPADLLSHDSALAFLRGQ